MMARGGAALYTSDILTLAVELARYPLDERAPLRGEAQSRVCGSRVIMGIDTGEGGELAAVGARVSACAIGQAAAALFLRSAKGHDAEGIIAALVEMEDWLRGSEATPAWPGIEVLDAARAYPARHAPILLPWKAALAALSKRDAAH